MMYVANKPSMMHGIIKGVTLDSKTRQRILLHVKGSSVAETARMFGVSPMVINRILDSPDNRLQGKTARRIINALKEEAERNEE